MNTQEKKCIDLVADKFAEQEQTYKDAQKYFDELLLINEDKQEQFKCKHKYNKFFYCEDLFDYVNQTALSWDYVEPYTFDDQREGYYRLQLSWGGPSDEFRIYTDSSKTIKEIEYWYLDWYDGACINVPKDSVSWDICSWYVDLT
tara:strand:+ start:1845 stop:2279 length:435 start_codon:yes stop_codon:yes gene_type:complete